MGNKFDVIILGGGASGCMCAMTILRKSKRRVLMIDSNKRPAKKLMVTGNGRCNISNKTCMPSINFYNQNIDGFLNRFTVDDSINFFAELGLVCYYDEEGRIYPITNSAKSVVDIINNELEKYENFTFLSDFIEKIDKKGEIFEILASNGKFICEKLVVALGGKIDKNLTDLDINLIPFKESLVALKTESTHFLNGIRVSPVRISNEEGVTFEGEILFKESGISGIAAFNLSAYFSRKKKFLGGIDLLPQYSQNELYGILSKRRALACPVNQFFDGLLSSQLAYHIFEECKVDEGKLSTFLTNEEIKRFTEKIKHLAFNVKSCYDNNQVMSGGVDLKSLTDNLESKKIKNLYFCGEICDVDGLCGGYNLQWAWTSGHIVGETI